ncbi:MAG: hypothetical protein AAGH64_08255 [Planctomycetota bacterium]
MEKLTRLFEADPSDADVSYMIAQEHAKAGDHDEAQAWYDRCLALDGSYHYAYFHKARSQQAADDEEGARATLEAGLGVATRDQNAKAIGEIGAYLDELS